MDTTIAITNVDKMYINNREPDKSKEEQLALQTL